MGNPRQTVRKCLCGALLARDNTEGRCTACMVKGRTNVGSAPEVAADFWEEPTIREALDDCHMGHIIRAFRQHPDHGRQPISQETAARWAGITQAQLSRIETGAPLGHIDKLVQWAEILRIPSFYLWFRVAGQERDNVKRGEFLRMGSLAIVGASTAALFGGASVTALAVDDCAQWLAWELWQCKRESLHPSEMPIEVGNFLRSYTARSTGQLILRDTDGLYSFAHPSFIDFYVAQRIFRRVADGDSSLFATIQTSHETDLVIRQFVQRDRSSADSLSHWMTRAPSPVLRVNSAGVLAKLDLPEFSDSVVTSLKRDADTRHLYLTAVTSRVLGMPWDRAGSHAAVVAAGSDQSASLTSSEAAFYVDRLAAEVHNPRDAAARWCAVVLLGQLRSAAPEKSTEALHQALQAERNTETLRSIGAVLAGSNPISF